MTTKTTSTTVTEEAASFSEYEAIANSLQPYIDAAHTGSGTGMRHVWFDHAHIVGSLDGHPVNLDANAFCHLIDRVGGSENVRARIVSIDYQGRAASARIEFWDWSGIRYFSPFSRRVAAALIALGIPYDHDDLNGYADPTRARELNPVGKVPVLVLDDGEYLIDSSAILDYIDEFVGTERALAPRSGADRRAMLRLAVIATTIYEQSTARSFEDRRSKDCIQPHLIERYRLQTIGGLQALDAAAGANGLVGKKPLNLATIGAVIAFEYAQATHPDLNPAAIAPNLARVVCALSDEPAFQQTRL